jgi:hypothetical protein
VSISTVNVLLSLAVITAIVRELSRYFADSAVKSGIVSVTYALLSAGIDINPRSEPLRLLRQ